MNWVTRHRIRVNRTATAWLIRRFLDPTGTVHFVEPGEVEAVQRRLGAVGFDAPGATYPHRDERGRCSFEALVEERLADDSALRELGRIVHGADFPAEIDCTAESAGLRAISDGFPLVSADDRATLEKASFVYDALYASLRERQASAR
jgi:hypothetical protein